MLNQARHHHLSFWTFYELIKFEFTKPWLNRIVAKLGRHVPHLLILKANSTGGERDDAKSDSEEVIHLIYQS